MSEEPRWSFALLGVLPTATNQADARRELRALQRLLLAEGARAAGAAFPPLEDLEELEEYEGQE